MAIIPQIITEDRASGAQVIDGSLRFDSGSSHYLNRTPSSTGNRRTWTWSGWVKFANIDKNDQVLFSAVTGSSYIHFRFMGVDSTNSRSHKLNVQMYDGSTSWNLYTRRVLRDSGSWYHLLLQVDYTQALAADRTKIYINGELTDQVGVSNSDSASFAAQNYETYANLSGAVNNIGYHSNYGEYFDGEISNVYLIDGLALGPQYFGFTDPLTNTWRPKKFRAEGTTVNDGTVWSGGIPGNVLSGYPATQAFDGNTSTFVYADNSSTMTWTAPKRITGELIEVYAYAGGNWPILEVNGKSTGAVVGGTTQHNVWVDVTDLCGGPGGILETITAFGQNIGGVDRSSGWSAVRVDGVTLIDSTTQNLAFGTNGFYLPFDGNSPIGEDKSGNGNNWTPVNFGGYNSIEKATGALPILNTVNGGATATATVREDANASNLIFALPLAGDITEVTPRINNARTALSFTDSGSTDTVVRHFYGGSRNFDGTNDFLKASIPDGDALHLQASSWTVECWFRADVLPGGSDVYLGGVRIGSSANSDVCWNLRIYNNVIEGLFVTSNTQYKTVSPSAITATKWTHVAYVRDGNEQRLYQDGVLVATTSHTTTPNLNNSSFLEIGGRTGSGFFNGKLQDFRIYNNLAKYTGDFIPAAFVPDIRPDTPSGVAYGSEVKRVTEGSVNGGVSNGDALIVGNSSDFDFGGGDFTVELFAYHTSTAGNDTLIGMWNSSANNRNWMIDIEADQGRLRGYWSTDGSSVSVIQTATNYITRRRWNHIVFCRQGNTMRLYLNGNQEATATESGQLFFNSTDGIGILSASDAGNDPCRGHISNVRVVKGTCIYPDGTSFTPPTEPLTNVTNTKLLCCQSSTMSSISDAAVIPSYAITVKSSNSGSGSYGDFSEITSTGSNYYYDNRPSQGGTGPAWIQLDFASTQSSVTSIKLSGGGYANGSTYDLYVNGVLVENDRSTQALWAEDTITISSTNIDSIRIYGSDGYALGGLKFNNTLVSGTIGGIRSTEYGSVSATTFNPFTDDINTVRGQENAYCILNSTATYNGDGGDIQDGGLKFECPASGDASARGTIPIPAGFKFYMEARYRAVSGSGGQARLGITQVQQGYTKSGTGMWSIDFRGSAGQIEKDDEGSLISLIGDPDQNDIVGIKIDLEKGEFRAHHRGIYYESGKPLMTGIPNVESYFFAALDGGPNRNDWADINFGQKPWRYPPGDGYQPLCSANLPKPTSPAAVNPDKYFNTVLWSGNSSTQAITGVGFQPDFVWGKARSVGYAHKLFDVVRGATKALVTSNQATEITVSGLTSFDSDGFTLGSNLDTNLTTHTYVAWCWKAGGAAVSNNDGSIASQISVNRDSGFSIVSYTGNNTAGATVGHGLPNVPKMYVIKDRDSVSNWFVFNSNLSTDNNLYLNTTDTEFAAGGFAGASATSSVIQLPTGGTGTINESGKKYICYAWSEVPGFSKFGSYTGNGAVNGPLIECGFRPAWVMVKVVGGSTGNSWTVWDNKRDTHNEMDLYLHPNEAQQDGTYSAIKMDFYSNGFKPRGDIIHQNTSGIKYIYMAFADVPTSNLYGAQATAR